MPYYFSLQYSAIQNTVLRHDRLWSIAGISQTLSWLNETQMPQIVERIDGKPIVSAGGKFTASFINKEQALLAKENIKKLISTTLPMLEVQYSDIVEADKLHQALHIDNGKGLINQLSEAKRCFRGYGFTYNPYLQVCDECGEYPAERGWDEDKRFCRICFKGYEKSVLKTNDLLAQDPQSLTSIERIYLKYLEQFDAGDCPQIPRNFENLFPSKKGDAGRQRMAVWASDINNIGDKVPLWFSQGEDAIPATLQKVSDFNINLISRTLKDVFSKYTVTAADKTKYMPFRIIVGGGDDLCVVMRDKDIMRFTLGLSKNLHHMLQEEVNSDYHHPLNLDYLNSLLDKSKNDNKLKPHSFGGAFVVVPLHTPFKAIHHISETLMKEAKQKTGRSDNSVNWRVLSTDEETASERIFIFDKPLIIEKGYEHYPQKITFEDYYEMAEKYKVLSNSHIQQIVAKALEIRSDISDGVEAGKGLENYLKRMPSASAKESLHNELIQDDRLKQEGVMSIKRLCTMFELVGVLK